MVGGQQQQSTDAVEQQQIISNTTTTSQQQIGSAQDNSISTTQIQPIQQIPMQQQTSDIISPLSTDPQIAQYNPFPNTNTQQHTPVGVLQQVAQQPLFQQQQQQTDATSTTNNSPPKAAVKKGRFRVVKGANEGKADDQSVPNSTANSTVKKGRFVVSKKPSSNNVTESTKDGKIMSPQESDASSTKSLKKIDNVKDATEKATNDQTKPNSPVVKKNSGKKSPIPQKKGRFLVTTAASSAANLQAVEAAAKLAASIGQDKDVNGDSSSVDQSVTKGDASRRGSLVDNQVSEVATKKKGRFVVKTGGNLTNSPGTNCTPPEVGVQQNGVGTQNIQQQQQPLPANIQMPAYFGNVNNNMPISGIVPTTSLVQDVNGQIMVVSNVFPICEQNIQQHNSTQHQQQQQAQIHQVYAPPVQNAITRVQSAISSIGSQAPQPLQPLPNFTDAPARPQQVSTEDNPPPASKAHVPRASRPAGSSGSNWSSLKGKNGRMIGGGGVGKVLHHLDTMRTEIVEADRTITSLQSDNRILRDKNKELEAKNKELLRILADEKRHRHTAEVNYQTLCQQVSSKHYERINSEQESTKSSAVDAPIQDTTDKEAVLETPISSFEDNLQQKPVTSTTQKDTVASTIQKSPRPKPPMSSSSISKSPKPTRPNAATIPRTSSFDSPKPTNKKVVRGLSPASAASQSMSCLPSVAFDPLARGIPVPDITTDTTCNVAPVIITTEELKLDESKQRHFDPLGTPERRVSVPTVVLNNEIPQIPIPMGGNSTVPAVIPIIQRQQNSKEEEDDPFDEIVSSRKRSTFSGK